MMDLGPLVLLRPAFLALLPALAILALLLRRRVAGLAGWERAVDAPLMRAMEAIGRVRPGTGRLGRPPLAVAAILALALIGPAARDPDAPTFRNLDGLVLVMDLSRSATEGGAFVDAQSAAQLVLQRAGARPVALVVYAGEAYLASAFTTDPGALETTISALDAETVPDRGSRPDRALELARATLAQARILAGEVVLVSDGGGVTPAAAEAARAIATEGGHVSAVFVPPRVSAGDMPPADERGLSQIASAGEGRLESGAAPAGIVAAMEARGASGLEAGGLAALLFRDYGRWLVALALLPALLLFRRSA